jgi:hypothetical protein
MTIERKINPLKQKINNNNHRHHHHHITIIINQNDNLKLN